MSTEWSTPTKYIVAVGLALLAVFVLYLSRLAIPLLIFAALIAIMVRPLIAWLHQRLRLPRGGAVALAYLVVVITVPLLFVLMVGAIATTFHDVLSADYHQLFQRSSAWMTTTLTSIQRARLPIAALDAYVDRTVDELLRMLGNAGPTALPSPPSADTIIRSLSSTLSVTFGIAASVVGTVLSRVALFAYMIITSLYMSLSAHAYRAAFLDAIPHRYQPEMAQLVDRIGRVWTAFLRGQTTLMLIIGVLVWLGLAALGVPGALSLGLVAGLLELIPNIGPVIATIPAVIVALLQGSTHIAISPLMLAVLVIAWYVLVQQLENSVIVPRVLGEAVDLPALVVITGVLVGGMSAGIVGAILATPIIATAREILRYAYLKLLGKEPFPPRREQPVPAERQGA